jgi:hypothetical protein
MHCRGTREKLFLERLRIEPRPARLIQQGEAVDHHRLCKTQLDETKSRRRAASREFLIFHFSF